MTDKYRAADAVIYIHPEKGVIRLDPERVDDDTQKLAKKHGWTQNEPAKDGFRPRRKRTKSDMKRLIEEGVVADPATGGQPHQTYGEDVFVVDVPLGKLDASAIAPD